MPSPSRVVIAFAKGDSDQRAASALAVGFGREGVAVAQVSEARDVLALLEKGEGAPEVVVASLHLEGGDDGLALTRTLRARYAPGRSIEVARPPVILVGDAEKRAAALAAGASAFMPKPAYVKDIMTLSGILSMARDGLEPGWGGELGTLHLYYVVRALGAARKNGVLSLVRSGRRGELRFYDGEVTSAQVGSLHGQAAFHQLLLWPEAHFDLRAEQVVRRQQIPLSPQELLQDAERFLRDFNELASGLSPSSVYEQDLARVGEVIEAIPKEVTPVLRLFDGRRSVADVIEDSPTRMAETLRIVKNLISMSAIVKPGTRASGEIAAVVDEEAGHHHVVGAAKAKRRAESPQIGAPAADWGALAQAPRAFEYYAPVVPAMAATGEISVADRPRAAGSSEPVAPVAAGNGKKRSKQIEVPMPAHEEVAVGDHAAADRTEPMPPPVMLSPDEVEPPARGKRSAPPPKTASGEISVPEVPSSPPVVNSPLPVASSHIEVSGDLPGVTTTASPPKPASKTVGRATGPHSKFLAHEEAFFQQEEHFAKAEAHPAESFADLDEGHARRPSFWKRLLRKLVPSA